MMSKLIYNYYKQSIFRFDKSELKLPKSEMIEISKNWKDINESGKRYINGDLFTVSNISVDDRKNLNFTVKKTNYAHYLYSVKNNFDGEYICRSIASNVLPITSDDYYVLGVMAKTTSLSNKIKFIGGAVSEDDLYEDRIKPLNCAKREALEEIGLDLNNNRDISNLEPKYFVTRKNLSFINVLFLASLNLSSNEVIQLFNGFKASLMEEKYEVEIDSILLVKNDINSIKLFLDKNKNNLIDYMEDLFLVLVGEHDAKNIIKEVSGI